MSCFFRAAVRPLFLLLVLSACSPKCYVKKDEQVDFYPTFIYRQPDGHWAMPVMAWVHDTEVKSSVGRGVEKLVELAALFPATGVDPLTSQEQVKPFLLHGQSGRTIPIEWEQKDLSVGASDSDGYIRQDLVMPIVPTVTSSGAWTTFQAKSCRGDPRTFRGQALVISEKGVSVVADLDALSEPDARWQPLFDRWGSQGKVFHYVSASPWQLFGSLSQRLTSQGLPPGVLQLRNLPLHSIGDSPEALLRSVAALTGSPAAYKTPAMESLLLRFPNRQFILVGDAVHQDAQIFYGLARKYPRQITHFWIVDTATARPQFYRQLFKGLPDSLWTIVPDPSGIKTD